MVGEAIRPPRAAQSSRRGEAGWEAGEAGRLGLGKQTLITRNLREDSDVRRGLEALPVEPPELPGSSLSGIKPCPPVQIRES